MKMCTRCKVNKPLFEFSQDKRASDGAQTRCRECARVIAKERRLANPETHRAGVRKSTQKHYAAKLARNTRYRRENPDKVSEWKRKDRQKNKARVLACNAMRRSQHAGETSSQVRQLYALRDFYRAMSLGEEFHVDHVVPLSKGGKHVFENLRVIPAIDNLRKGASIERH